MAVSRQRGGGARKGSDDRGHSTEVFASRLVVDLFKLFFHQPIVRDLNSAEVAGQDTIVVRGPFSLTLAEVERVVTPTTGGGSTLGVDLSPTIPHHAPAALKPGTTQKVAPSAAKEVAIEISHRLVAGRQIEFGRWRNVLIAVVTISSQLRAVYMGVAA